LIKQGFPECIFPQKSGLGKGEGLFKVTQYFFVGNAVGKIAPGNLG